MLSNEKAESFRKCFIDTLEEVKGDKPYSLTNFIVKLYELQSHFAYDLQIHILYTPYGFNYISTCPEPINQLTPETYHIIWEWFRDISQDLIEKLDEMSKNSQNLQSL